MVAGLRGTQVLPDPDLERIKLGTTPLVGASELGVARAEPRPISKAMPS